MIIIFESPPCKVIAEPPRPRPTPIAASGPTIPRYWMRGRDLHCRHGIILYGNSCAHCERGA